MANKNWNITLLGLATLVLLFALNLLFSLLFGGFYFDITNDKRYTLTSETKKFLEDNKEPINIRLYVSNNLKNDELSQYAKYLRKLFDEYVKNSKNKLELIVVEVKPFTNTQAQAEKAEVKEFDFGDGVKHQYLGASFSNSKGRTIAISNFWPNRKPFVEDDITRVLSVLASRNRPVLGVMSPYFKVVESKHSLSSVGSWPFVKQLELAGYEIVRLSETSFSIDNRIDAVLVFYPMNLDVIGKYAIDQYLMRGGNVIVMLDSFAEERFKEKEDFFGYNSGLKDFLANVGVDYLENIVVGDNENGRSIVLDGNLVQYPFKILVKGDNIKKHNVMAGVNQLFVNHSGFFDFKKVDNIETNVLFATSEQSGVILAKNIADISYDNLIKNYETTEYVYPLALMLEGKFKSLYTEPLYETDTALQQMPPFLSIPLKKAKLALIADVDMMSEIFWNANADGKTEGYSIVYSSDNFKFLRNLVDYMTESGFIGIANKRLVNGYNSLSKVFFNIATALYAKQKRNIEEKLVEIRHNILLRQEQYGVNVVSVKQVKDIERLRREELDVMQQLRKITYQTKEAYDSYLVFFAVLMIGVFPLLLTVLIWGIYYIYSRWVKRLAEDVINE